MELLILLQILGFYLIVNNLKLLSSNEYDLMIIRGVFIAKSENFYAKKRVLEFALGISMNLSIFILSTLLILRGFDYGVNDKFLSFSWFLSICVLTFNVYANIKLNNLKTKIKNCVELNYSTYKRSARKKLSSICNNIEKDLYITHFSNFKGCNSINWCCILKIFILTTLIGFLITQTILKTTKMDRLKELHYAWKLCAPYGRFFYLNFLINKYSNINIY